MPREDDQKPKRRPGRPTYRTFHDRIGFQIEPPLHAAINIIAQERGVRFEEIYAEAVRHALTVRKDKSLYYIASPPRRYAKRVTVPMEPSLGEAARAASEQDQRRLNDFFQTAIRLYLEHLDRLPPEIPRESVS